jgi:2-methylaconitate cis-trans-isomerase PrpF
MQFKIKSVLMRGGTSRALIFKRGDLPASQELQKRIFISTIGTPDPKQIDGVGGTTSSTSKIAIIEKSSRPGIDIDYTFVQVGVREAMIDTSGNCGNLSSAVGPFAVDEGLVEAKEPYTEVNIFNTNTNKRLTATFKVAKGRYDPEGDFSIDGVLQKGSEIKLKFLSPVGSITDKALPTGNLSDRIIYDGREYEYTIIDITNPYIFVSADQFLLTGKEKPPQLDSSDTLRVLQGIRDRIAKDIGYDFQAFPKITALTANDLDGTDVRAISISMGRTHKTIPLTGAMCLAGAMGLHGTVPNKISGIKARAGYREFSIAHLEGMIKLGVDYPHDFASGKVDSVTCSRTARRIMEGYVYASL